MTRGRRQPGVLFVGQSYYHTWYLSRELRRLGWRADVLNWDLDDSQADHYHGEDFGFRHDVRGALSRQLAFYGVSLRQYDIFHFSNAHGMSWGHTLGSWFADRYGHGEDVRFLKRLGKKVTYANNGCLDGVTQSSFAAWGEEPVCLDCPWRDRPDVCSDERNAAWGRLRNDLADAQLTVGSNRRDFNDDPTIEEIPQFYCLDPHVWRPNLPVPSRARHDVPPGTVKLYHAVGNFALRSRGGRNVKSTHLWLPLIEELRAEGHPVELIFAREVPNLEVRFHQVQADVVCEMLTYGWFGANAREALMLGKPVICYLRPEWLEQIRGEVPGYVEELPVVSASPETVREVLLELVHDPDRRAELGRRGREFALKWHSAQAGARRLDRFFRGVLAA